MIPGGPAWQPTGRIEHLDSGRAARFGDWAVLHTSLLGLIRHTADVERNWFRRVMAQTGAPPLYWSEDPSGC